MSTVNRKGFTPVVTALIVAAILALSFGAYRMSKLPSSSLVPQEQSQPVPKGIDVETEHAVEQEVLGTPSLAPKPSWLEEEKVQTEEEAFGVNYSQAGNLTSGNGLEGWVLLYDTPGNPATTNPLKFTGKSMCDMGQGQQPCAGVTLQQGDRVNIDGNKQQHIVSVILLKKL